MSQLNNEGTQKILQTIENLSAQLAQLKQLVHDYSDSFDEQHAMKKRAAAVGATGEDQYGVVIEGVFDGQQMVGPDGTSYNVPANYASKSKLVEGDVMKLTITDEGAFIYKQIGPIERKRIVGSLVYDDTTGAYKGLSDEGRSYRLLTASVTYYKGRAGDHVILLVPEDGDSRWAAVENIIPAAEEVPAMDTLAPLNTEMSSGTIAAEALQQPKIDPAYELESGEDMELLPGEDMLLDEPRETRYDADPEESQKEWNSNDWKV